MSSKEICGELGITPIRQDGRKLYLSYNDYVQFANALLRLNPPTELTKDGIAAFFDKLTNSSVYVDELA